MIFSIQIITKMKTSGKISLHLALISSMIHRIVSPRRNRPHSQFFHIYTTSGILEQVVVLYENTYFVNLFASRPIFPVVAAPWMRLWTWHYRYKAEVCIELHDGINFHLNFVFSMKVYVRPNLNGGSICLRSVFYMKVLFFSVPTSCSKQSVPILKLCCFL